MTTISASKMIWYSQKQQGKLT